MTGKRGQSVDSAFILDSYALLAHFEDEEGGAGLHVAESAVPSQTQHGETIIFLDNQA